MCEHVHSLFFLFSQSVAGLAMDQAQSRQLFLLSVASLTFQFLQLLSLVFLIFLEIFFSTVKPQTHFSQTRDLNPLSSNEIRHFLGFIKNNRVFHKYHTVYRFNVCVLQLMLTALTFSRSNICLLQKETSDTETGRGSQRLCFILCLGLVV